MNSCLVWTQKCTKIVKILQQEKLHNWKIDSLFDQMYTAKYAWNCSRYFLLSFEVRMMYSPKNGPWKVLDSL